MPKDKKYSEKDIDEGSPPDESAKSKYQIIDYAGDYPDTHELKTGIKALDTPENLEWLLRQFKITMRYNLMTRQVEMQIPGCDFLKDKEANLKYEFIHNICILNKMPTVRLLENINKIAADTPYHPIRDCILNKPWDELPRLNDFIETIEADEPLLAHKIIKTWMTAAIACAFSDNGFSNQGVLVIYGKQGVGKTSFAKSLDPLNCGAIKEGAILNPADWANVLALAQYWIVELGEVDSTFRKADIARLKSFITASVDHVRFLYDTFPTPLPRRTAYIATVNDEQFLVDTTGNRRWWTIKMLSVNLNHSLDMQQVWAEVYRYWRLGAHTSFADSDQQLVDNSNIQYEKIDPLEETLLGFYDWEDPNYKKMTATEILIEMKWPRIDAPSANNLSRILTKITGRKGVKSNGKVLREVPTRFNIDWRR